MLGKKFLKGNINLREISSELGKDCYEIEMVRFSGRAKLLRGYDREVRKDSPLSDHPFLLLDGFMERWAQHLLSNGDIALSITYMMPRGRRASFQNLRAAVRLKQLRNSEPHAGYYDKIGDAAFDSCAAIGLRLLKEKHHRAAFHFLAITGKAGERALTDLGLQAQNCEKLRLSVECFSVIPKEGAQNLLGLGSQLVAKGDLYYAAKSFTVAGQSSPSLRKDAVNRLSDLQTIADTLSDDVAQQELNNHLQTCMRLIHSSTPPSRFAFPNCLVV